MPLLANPLIGAPPYNPMDILTTGLKGDFIIKANGFGVMGLSLDRHTLHAAAYGLQYIEKKHAYLDQKYSAFFEPMYLTQPPCKTAIVHWAVLEQPYMKWTGEVDFFETDQMESEDGLTFADLLESYRMRVETEQRVDVLKSWIELTDVVVPTVRERERKMVEKNSLE